MSPRFTIVSPCLNGMPFVPDAVQSVRAQQMADVQHIVVDGGSRDGTLKYLATCPDVMLLHAPGSSIYEALNVGLAHATGDLIGFLNVDDCYRDGAFAAIDAVHQASGADALCGRADLLADAAGLAPQVRLRQEGDVLTRATLGDPCLNAWFFARPTVERLGRFDPRYRIAGDREWLLRLLVGGVRVQELARTVYGYRVHAASATFTGNEALWQRTLREHNRMTSALLAQPGLPARARQQLRQARTRDTLAGALFAARSNDLPGFIAHAGAGLRHDACWPARFAARAWQAALRRAGPAPDHAR